MKRLLMTMALTCVLFVTTLAGEIPTVPGPQPLPLPQGMTQSADATPGEIPCDGAEQVWDAELSGLLSAVFDLLVLSS